MTYFQRQRKFTISFTEDLLIVNFFLADIGQFFSVDAGQIFQGQSSNSFPFVVPQEYIFSLEILFSLSRSRILSGDDKNKHSLDVEKINKIITIDFQEKVGRR